MPEHFITRAELTAALAEHGIHEKTEDIATSAEVSEKIEAAISTYKEEQEAAEKAKEEKENAPVSDWRWWVPTELNAFKSEFTAFKAEWVPILLTLPAVFSFDEFLQERFDLEYRNGFLRKKRPTENIDENPPPNDPENPSNPRNPNDPENPSSPRNPNNPDNSANDTPPRNPPSGGTPPPGGGAPDQPRPRRTPTTPRPPADPVGPAAQAANQVRPQVQGATSDLRGLQNGLNGASNAADGG